MGGCATLSETSGEYLMLCQHARNPELSPSEPHPSSVLLQAGALRVENLPCLQVSGATLSARVSAPLSNDVCWVLANR